MVRLEMMYNYKGSSNAFLTLSEQPNGDIDLITDFGETITSVQTGYGLIRILEDLNNNRYA